MWLLLCVGLIVSLTCSTPTDAQIVLNEYVSSNLNGLVDEDGDTSDWIELYNVAAYDIDLDGYGISDDPAEPFKWVFPRTVVPARQHVLVFASGKDRGMPVGHWETVIDHGDPWRYRVNSSAPPEDWRAERFDHSSWSEGPTGIGYGDDDDATIIPNCISVSMRHLFSISDPEGVQQLYLHVDYDDAFIAWINEVEVARSNISSFGDPAWDLPANEEREAQMYGGGWPQTFAVNLGAIQLNPGSNVLAIEVHNVELASSDMSLIPFLTLGLDEEPPDATGVPAVIRPLLPHMHTNFKLSAEGENLSLHDDGGNLLDAIATGQMFSDISRGRAPDGGPDWLLFSEPTPETTNGETGFLDYAASPEFSVPGGLYGSSVTVTINASDPGATIYYTTDGTDPHEASSVYANPIYLPPTSVLRARAHAPDMIPSRITTATYVIDDLTTLPVTSLVTDPVNLWDPDSGIFVEQNLWAGWERPVHVEFYETDGSLGFAQDAGVKVYGGWTRTFPQKSVRLIARAGYGAGSFDYELFDERPYSSFQQLVWRNSGNDWCESMLRDGLMHRLLAHTDIDRLAYRPSRIYLNGEYWGIANTRERIDEDYLSSLHGVDPENLDLIKNYIEIHEGDTAHYNAMLYYIVLNGLADPADYAYIQTQMDVEEFADYEVFEIFYANFDWPGNNIAYWRPRTAEGRWRWIIYDTDFGLGLYSAYFDNALAFALEPHGEDWPNPPHSTYLLRSLVENDSFRRLFINRYADHLNTSFLPTRTLPIAQQVAAGIEAEIARHQTRWERPVETWNDQMNIIYEFLELRPAFARQHLREQFGLGGDVSLSLDITPVGAGRIQLAAIAVDSTWSGSYFLGVPITLTALPAAGYAFAGWSDGTLPQQPTVEIAPEGDYGLTAIFEPSAGSYSVVINEINYNGFAGTDPGDWVELHNPGTTVIDLAGWIFKDEDDDHIFVIPDETSLPAGGYLVLCEDNAAFASVFPTVNEVIGDLGFGFAGGGELLRLFDGAGALADSVRYDDEPPWPPEPDGNGPTLELIAPALDNGVAASWAASTGYGTPAALNSVTTTGVDEPAGPALALLAPYPNPGNPQIEIGFSVDQRRHLTLTIHDLAGRRVRTLARGEFVPGIYRRDWFGDDDRGHTVSSGVYLLRLEAGDHVSSRKLTLLK